MAEIKLQFCAFDSTVAKIIEWGTQGDVGHVDIVLPDGSLLGAQHEAGLGGKPSGVQIRPANYGDSCGMLNRQRVRMATTERCAAAALAWALSMVGSPYDTRAIEGIACGEDWSSEGHFICSGLATGMLCQPGPSFLTYPLVRHWRVYSPEQLMILCNAFAPVVPA